MSATLYFSKVNINSHIFDVYNDKKELVRILKYLYVQIQEGTEYKREDERLVSEGEVYLYEASYKFINIDKLDGDLSDTVVGSIIKTSPIFINEADSEGNIRKKAVENSEIIDFYFDVLKEIVVFHTTNRFGYQDFNLAFKKLINLCTSREGEEFNFEVSLLKKGLNVEKIHEELKLIGEIETLKIEIIPPNADDELLDDIQRNGEEFLNRIKAGNVTNTSTIFVSKAPQGVNVDSSLIKDELSKIDKIHSKLSGEEAVQKGYVTVEAINKSGRFYTTNDNKPVKDVLDEKPNSLYEFALICKKKLSTVLNSLR